MYTCSRYCQGSPYTLNSRPSVSKTVRLSVTVSPLMTISPSSISSRHHLRVPKPCDCRMRSRACLLITAPTLQLNDAACFGEFESHIARIDAFRVAVAQAADEIGFHSRAGEEQLVHGGVV